MYECLIPRILKSDAILFLGSFFVSSWFGMFAWSADLSDDLRNKVSDFSMELTQCAAYYSMVSHCAENGGQAELAKTADAAYHNLTPLIFESGKIAGLNSAALLGRLQMSIDSMKADMSNTCTNLAAIYKYAMLCKSLVENPDERLRALLGGR